MATTWQDEAIPILRTLIGDFDGTSYATSRLETILVHAAYYINTRVDFEYDYVVNAAARTISPDPSDNTDKDFINLMTIKAAVLVLGSEVKTAAAQSYRISDGPSSIDTSASFKAKKEFYDKMSQDFEMAVLHYQAGNGKAGQAILTPYTQEINGNTGYTFY